MLLLIYWEVEVGREKNPFTNNTIISSFGER
jgi:hypothetical protein